MPTIERDDGTTIHYDVHGEGEPVVLIMGLGVDGHGWDLQVPGMAARHHVIVVDNRGVGRSGKPAGPYSIPMMADDVAAVLDAVGTERAHVVGVSMGGMIAQELTLRHPSRVGALVLGVTFARPGEEVRATSEQGGAQIASGVGSAGPSPLALMMSGQLDLSAIDVRQAFSFLMPLVLSEKFLREKRAWLAEMLDRSIGYGFSMKGLAAQIAAVLAHDTVARLPSLRAPTLIVTGSKDRLVPPRHSDELAALIPGSRLVVREGGTHGINFEDAEWFQETILDHLARHPLAEEIA